MMEGTDELFDRSCFVISFGLAIYYLGRKMEWNRHSKIVAGLAVASIFIIFSTCYVTISSAAHSRSFLT